MRYQLLNGIMFGGSAALCMAFPVNLTADFQWDLRCIPVIISIVYSKGKWIPGIISALIVELYGYCAGGDAAALIMIGFAFMIAPSFLFAKSFAQSPPIKRVAVSLALALYSTLVMIVLLVIHQNMGSHIIEQPTYRYFAISVMALVSLIGMGISALLNEHIIESALLRLELERSEKLKIVSQIAASVAHEVRNPLTVVKGFLQLLKGSVDDRQKEYLIIALSELDRAEFIISDYLNLAKPQAEHLEIIEVSDFLNHTVEIMNSYSLIQNVAMHLNCNQTDLFILADKPRLTQVILNLIKNGVEAIPATGDVTVNAYYRNEEIVIEVIDTGIGMTKENLDHIGKAFFTTKDSGTGLGILVTIRIIEAMHGKITFESEVGVGTKVTIRLPAAPYKP
ncbi:ATP-binding protein [Paenibacillus harenae]|uniref:ATP-binding protein n=1 Tax=Paenibacillus harenae TaxID=306543 RepID=UPI00040986B8|nr:ATP-binding protein [Paenibacillus harenae]